MLINSRLNKNKHADAGAAALSKRHDSFNNCQRQTEGGLVRHDSRLMKRGNANATLACRKGLRAPVANLDVFVLMEGIKSGADNTGQEQTRL